MRLKIFAVVLSVLLILRGFTSFAYDQPTHDLLSRQAVASSNLDNFLRDVLGFPGGVVDSVSSKPIIDLIGDGSYHEDDGVRFLNHFHNPLRTWNQAGLLGSTLGKSSIVWGQTRAQGYAWQKARDEYFSALTATTQDARETHFREMFSAIGHLIHLVQDAAQPAHTRDDPHPLFNGLEGYVESLRADGANGNGAAWGLFDSWLTSPPVGFDPVILTGSQNGLAPIPVARIIDTTDPAQTSAVPSAGIDQGLAEYTNANFLSEDTIFKDFTFPRVESLGPPVELANPVTGRSRRYFPKVVEGDSGYYLVAEGVWWETLASLVAGDQGYILDSEVRNGYAAKLLPRAVGYSAGLINYFFRGTAGGIGCCLDLWGGGASRWLRGGAVWGDFGVWVGGMDNEKATDGSVVG